MKSRRLAISLLAVSAFACSNSDDTGDSGTPVPERDAATIDVSADISSGTDGAVDSHSTDAGTGDGATTDAGDGGSNGMDASRADAATDSGTTFDASRDAVSNDAHQADAPALDVTLVDGALPDGGDPTTPPFPRTGKYSIVIPPLGDAGAGTSDAGDGGIGDPAEVYYPDPPDLHTTNYLFPIVLLFQGAKVARNFYSGVAAGVAAYGFVVVTPDHMSNNIGGPGLYAELSEIAAAGAQMKIENANMATPVHGVVDVARIAIMGHSYGGASGISGMANMCFPPIPGCTFARPPELVAGIFYGTNLATPIVGVPMLDTGGLPVLLVQGDKDGKALPADGQRTYDAIQRTPKAIINLLGANHYGVTDVDNPAGADPEVNAQTLDHATGVASTARWMGVFLAAFLHGDPTARAALRSAGTIDPHITITLAE